MMTTYDYVMILGIVQLLGIKFYFDNEEKAKTKVEKAKLILMSSYPLLVAISIMVRPLEQI